MERPVIAALTIAISISACHMKVNRACESEGAEVKTLALSLIAYDIKS
jgi:hypothetical protein